MNQGEGSLGAPPYAPTPPPASVPPGWYADPWRVGPVRWWDGAGWTAWMPWMPAPMPWLPAPDPAQQIAAARASTARWEKWAQVAVAVLCIGVTAVVASQLAFISPSLSNVNGLPNNPGLFFGYQALSVASELLALVAVIVIATWQYHAATTAQRLGPPFGYQSRIPPALGAVLWVVPLVNAIVPAMAIWDCLPAGHRNRRWVVVGFAVGGAGALSCYVGSLITGLNQSFTFNGVSSTQSTATGAVVALAIGAALLVLSAVCGCVSIQAIRQRHAEDAAKVVAPRPF